MSSDKSPYLTHQRRLSDIIAGIQVLGAYPKYASRDISQWNTKLDLPLSATSWVEVFKDHSEFFRVKNKEGINHAALRWRWALDKDYDYEKGRTLNSDEMSLISNDKKEKLTRPPLKPSQIEMLIDTAVNLHSSAISLQNQKRWWIQVIIPSAVGLIGALLGFLAPIIAEILKATLKIITGP